MERTFTDVAQVSMHFVLVTPNDAATPFCCRLAVSPLSAPQEVAPEGRFYHVCLGGNRLLYVLRLRKQPAKGEVAAGEPHGEVLVNGPTEGDDKI